MSKVTKKQLQRDIYNLATELTNLKIELLEKKVVSDKPKPQLKQLDQSVFNGLDEKWLFAAVDGDTSVYTYEARQHIEDNRYWVSDFGMQKYIGTGYDTSNWQNSLIERDKVELTGSDLCRAMLARGDKYVLSDVGGGHNVQVIGGWTEHGFTSRTNQFCLFRNPIPINNQGEPLTASEVGL